MKLKNNSSLVRRTEGLELMEKAIELDLPLRISFEEYEEFNDEWPSIRGVIGYQVGDSKIKRTHILTSRDGQLDYFNFLKIKNFIIYFLSQ